MIDDPSTCLIDTLPADFYSGEITIYARPGHIFTGSTLSGVDLIDATGHYNSVEELALLHQGYDPKKSNDTYCGGASSLPPTPLS